MWAAQTTCFSITSQFKTFLNRKTVSVSKKKTKTEDTHPSGSMMDVPLAQQRERCMWSGMEFRGVLALPNATSQQKPTFSLFNYPVYFPWMAALSSLPHWTMRVGKSVDPNLEDKICRLSNILIMLPRWMTSSCCWCWLHPRAVEPMTTFINNNLEYLTAGSCSQLNPNRILLIKPVAVFFSCAWWKQRRDEFQTSFWWHLFTSLVKRSLITK